MTDEELLEEVKKRIGVTGTYQDGTITGHIQDVKDFMIDAGVNKTLMTSKTIIGAVTRGVSDLWNYGSGNGEFSTYFYQRVTQLCYGGGENEGL
nr:MAG TPA: tail connector protein [Caudoviricetes sp.]